MTALGEQLIEALVNYQRELAESGIAPMDTSPEQEAKLQRLAVEVWKEQRAS